MATILIKRSKSAGVTPNLQDGELGINQADMKLYVKNATGSNKFIDFTSDAEKVASGPIATALGNKANISGQDFGGTVAVRVATDAALVVEDISAPTTTYRSKAILSSKNIEGGDGLYFRFRRPSDGALKDFLLSGPAGTILTTGNFNPATKADLTGAVFTGDITTYRPNDNQSGKTGVVYLGNQSQNGGRYLFYDSVNYTMPGADLYINGSKAYHAGNFDPTKKLDVGASVLQDASANEKHPWEIKQASDRTVYQYGLPGSVGIYDTKDGVLWAYNNTTKTFGFSPSVTVNALTASGVLNVNNNINSSSTIAGASIQAPPTTTQGGVALQRGGDTQAGYVEFYPKTGSSRRGYIGFGDTSRINIVGETARFNFTGQEPTVNDFRIWHGNNLLVIQPGAYGLNGTGAVDDYLALQTLVNNCADGTTILFIYGVYSLSQAVVVTNKSVGFVGASGVGVKFLCNQHGVRYNTVYITTRIHVENIIFERSGADPVQVGYSAIYINRPAGLGSSTEPGPMVKGCTFWGLRSSAYSGGQPGYSTAWYIGIEVIAGWNMTIEDNFFRGKDSNYDSIFLHASDHTTPVTFRNNYVYFAAHAVYLAAGSFAEGLNAYSNQFVAVVNGFSLDDGGGAPLAQIFGNHINCSGYAVRAINRPQIMVSHNLIYNWNYQGATQGMGNSSFKAIQLENCPDSDVSTNTVVGFNGSAGVSGNTVGVVISNCDRSAIHDNKIQGCQTGFDGVGTFRGTLYNNTMYGIQFGFIQGLTSAVRSWNNYNYNDVNNPVAI